MEETKLIKYRKEIKERETETDREREKEIFTKLRKIILFHFKLSCFI